MQYIEDNNLTSDQEELKWSIYCELEFEPNSDIIAVLKSLLLDMDDWRV